MATYSSTNYLTNGAKVRSSSNQPEWFSYTYKLPSTLTLATGDVIKFAKMGANQQILQYAVSTTGSVGTGTGTDGALAIGSTSLDASVGNFGGTNASIGEIVVLDHVSADEDDLKLTLGTMDTATTSGTRSIHLRVLVAAQTMTPSQTQAPQTFPTLA